MKSINTTLSVGRIYTSVEYITLKDYVTHALKMVPLTLQNNDRSFKSLDDSSQGC